MMDEMWRWKGNRSLDKKFPTRKGQNGEFDENIDRQWKWKIHRRGKAAGISSRDEATLKEGASVGPSVRRSVGNVFT